MRCGIHADLQPSNQNLDFPHVAHVLLITLAHELMHHLMQWSFGDKRSPAHVGRLQDDGLGESGWELEDRLFGGTIIATFDESGPYVWEALRGLLWRTGIAQYSFWDLSSMVTPPIQARQGELMR